MFCITASVIAGVVGCVIAGVAMEKMEKKDTPKRFKKLLTLFNVLSFLTWFSFTFCLYYFDNFGIMAFNLILLQFA